MAQAIEAIGIGERDGEDVVLTVIAADGKVVNHLLPEIAEEDVSAFPALYTPSGTFKHGTVSAKDGRTRDNVARVLWVPLDCDLLDWLQTPKDKANLDRAKADLWASTDEALDAMLAAQRADIERVIAQVGFPIHRLDVTGYGHCAYLRVADDDQLRVDDAGAAAKHLIGAINSVAGYQLADPQASDPGPRITRVPGSFNCKGALPRIVRTLYQIDGTVPLGTNPARRQSVVTPVQIPDVGRGLDQAGCDAIVRAVAPLWGPGARNGIAFGLGGMMAKVKMPESQAVAIVTALADGDDELADRLSAVKRSYARVRSGRETAGFTWLRDVLADDALAEVDRALGVLRPRVTLKTGRRIDEETADPASFLLPDAVLHGPIGSYVRLVSPTTEAPDALILGGFLAVLSASVARRVQVAYARPLYPNLYICVVGATGFSRKDHAIDAALDAMTFMDAGGRRAKVPFSVVTDVSSAEGLVKDLEDDPRTLLRLRELSLLLDNAQRKGTRTITDKLIELWDTPPDTANRSKFNGRVVKEPYLCAIAPTQPDRLERKMGEEDVVSGFANRWLYIFGGEDKSPIANPVPASSVAVANILQAFLRSCERLEGRILSLDAESRERWDAWYVPTLLEARGDPIGGAMRARCHPMARKLALLYAITDDATEIRLPHLEAGIALADWSWVHLKKSIYGWGAGDEVRLERRIVEVLESKGAMKRWKLQGACKRPSWPQTMFHKVVEAMTRTGTLVIAQDGIVALREQIEGADQ